jgi:hypothetical protein
MQSAAKTRTGRLFQVNGKSRQQSLLPACPKTHGSFCVTMDTRQNPHPFQDLLIDSMHSFNAIFQSLSFIPKVL